MASYESYPEKPQTPPEDKGKRRLRTTLAILIVLLLVVAALVGVMIWRNGTMGNARQPDTEALSQSTAGVSTASFSAVQLEGMPPCSKLYGKTLAQLQNIKGSQLVFDSKKLAPVGELPAGLSGTSAKPRYQATAALKGTQGVHLTLYFGKKKTVVGAYYYFDLDELGVAEAEFSVYLADGTVASSLLTGVGLSENRCSKTAVQAKTAAAPVQEDSGQRSCTISDATGAKLKKTTATKKVYSKKKGAYVKKKVTKKVQVDFMSWELCQSYRYSAEGQTTRSAELTL
ncbi:MAG: hypothetical protein ACI36W_02155, partial [Coriobacteriales bacterium]